MNQNTHEIHQLEGEKLPIIFHYDIVRKRTSFIGNWHENIELLYFISGSGQILCNSVYYDVREGDLFIVNSNHLHSISSETQCEYFCLIVDSDFLMSNGLNPEEIEFHPVVRSEQVETLYKQLVHTIYAKDSYRITAIRAHILTLMLHLARFYSDHAPATRSKESVEKNIKDAISFIKANLSHRLSLEELASQANLSKYYFAREFKKATGMTVVAYINAVRCSNARKLLLTQKYSVHEIASMCGFENDSYFSKTYKSIMGCLPSEAVKHVTL